MVFNCSVSSKTVFFMKKVFFLKKCYSKRGKIYVCDYIKGLKFEISQGITSWNKYLRVLRRTVCILKNGKIALTNEKNIKKNLSDSN